MSKKDYEAIAAVIDQAVCEAMGDDLVSATLITDALSKHMAAENELFNAKQFKTAALANLKDRDG